MNHSKFQLFLCSDRSLFNGKLYEAKFIVVDSLVSERINE